MLTRRTRVIAASPRPANQGRPSRVKLHCTELHANRVDGDRTLRPGATPRLLGLRLSAPTLFVKTNPRKFARAGREGLRFPLGRALRSPGTESMIIKRGENLLLLSSKGDMMISRIK